MNSLSFLLICFAGWMNCRQQAAIEYLQEEVRVLQDSRTKSSGLSLRILQPKVRYTVTRGSVAF